ncbi:hypothetical protein HMPREF9374_2153 [Desmospora sp. 8437]|nr:hypothetical protein HMPREF9374_2153 [Desmospora sp. 8437]
MDGSLGSKDQKRGQAERGITRKRESRKFFQKGFEKAIHREGWVSHGVILDRKNNENDVKPNPDRP